MKSKTLRADLLLLLTSAIWGFAFVAQRTGMKFMGPFTYNGIRFALGSLSLLPLIVLLRKRNKSDIRNKSAIFGKETSSAIETAMVARANASGRALLPGSILLGTVLFFAASLQQVGMQYTGAGKAGFITGLYVVLVPIFGIALKHKTGAPTWIGVIAAVFGLYFLSATGGLEAINPGDLLVAASAVFWAIHVLLIDYYSKRADPVELAAGQFAICAIASLVVAIAQEHIALESVLGAAVPIAYGGLFSVGIAYTLQIVAQKDAPPAHSAILLSLEGVFAAIGGALILSERLSASNMIGCALMLLGMLATQWEMFFARRRPLAH
jgi:drug/metabolite transporter (DMT)-like permease